MDKQLFEPIAPNSRSKYAYDQIRGAIVSGELKPGTVLYQKELAKQLNISEIPVREALRQLVGEGFIKYEPHNGAVVSNLSKSELLDIMAVSHYLEVMALNLSVPNLTDDDLAKARDILVQMVDAASLADIRGYGAANRGFHACLYSRCPNKYLLQLIMLSWEKSEFTRSLAISKLKPSRMLFSIEEHRRILEAAERRETELLIQLVTVHQEKTLSAISQIPGETWPG